MKKNKQSLKSNNKTSIISVIIIGIYFILPYIINNVESKFPSSFGNYINIGLNILFLMILLFIYKKDIKEDFVKIKKDPKMYAKKLIIFLFLMILSVALINAIVISIFHIKNIAGNEQTLYHLFKTYPLVTILLTIVYYPILEGIIFRKTIKNIITDKRLFIIVTCLLYFFFNIVYSPISFQNIVSSLYYIVLMFYMSKIYWDTDNFSISVILLMLYNIFVTLISI